MPSLPNERTLPRSSTLPLSVVRSSFLLLCVCVCASARARELGSRPLPRMQDRQHTETKKRTRNELRWGEGIDFETYSGTVAGDTRARSLCASSGLGGRTPAVSPIPTQIRDAAWCGLFPGAADSARRACSAVAGDGGAGSLAVLGRGALHDHQYGHRVVPSPPASPPRGRASPHCPFRPVPGRALARACLLTPCPPPAALFWDIPRIPIPLLPFPRPPVCLVSIPPPLPRRIFADSAPRNPPGHSPL